MKILFVCEGNVIRSQMAEAFLRHYAPEVEVMSAGTYVPQRREGTLAVYEYADAVPAMQEIGIDMSKAVSNQLTPDMLEWADKVVLVGPVRLSNSPYLRKTSKLEEWQVPDPGYAEADVRVVRDMVHEKIKNLVKELQA